MSWFKSSPEAPKPTEASEVTSAESKAEKPKRERPDFAALAQQRNEAFKQKTESKWTKLKNFVKGTRDVVVTLDKRVAYGGGVAKDAAVEKAQAAGQMAKETYRTGKAGVESAWKGIQEGAERAKNNFDRRRTQISEGIRDMRQKIEDSAEMRTYYKEKNKVNERNKKIQELMDQNGMSQDVMNEITRKFQERVAAKGVDFESLGFEQEEAMAA